jgi:hypothetical protein
MIERRFFHECPLHNKIVTSLGEPVKENFESKPFFMNWPAYF